MIDNLTPSLGNEFGCITRETVFASIPFYSSCWFLDGTSEGHVAACCDLLTEWKLYNGIGNTWRKEDIRKDISVFASSLENSCIFLRNFKKYSTPCARFIFIRISNLHWTLKLIIKQQKSIFTRYKTSIVLIGCKMYSRAVDHIFHRVSCFL